jgi:Cof subfamily protein (haloacid dehalogenase superfamily)
MKNIQLVGIDVDGTLVTSDKRITQETKDAFALAAKHNITTATCTGRTLCELEEICRELPTMPYAVCNGGASVIDLHNHEIILQNSLDIDLVQKLYKIISKYDSLFEVFTLDYIWDDPAKLQNLEHFVLPDLQALVKKTRTPSPKPMADFLETTSIKIDKIHVFFASIPERDKAWKEIEHLPVFISAAEKNNLEICSNLANKGNGLLALGRHLGLSVSQISAIGDSNNDIEMMKAAGYPVAVANANQTIKDLSSFITKSNDENGVAYFLHQLCGE